MASSDTTTLNLTGPPLKSLSPVFMAGSTTSVSNYLVVVKHDLQMIFEMFQGVDLFASHHIMLQAEFIKPVQICLHILRRLM